MEFLSTLTDIIYFNTSSLPINIYTHNSKRIYKPLRGTVWVIIGANPRQSHWGLSDVIVVYFLHNKKNKITEIIFELDRAVSITHKIRNRYATIKYKQEKFI